MSLFAFELGRKKELCFAELVAVLGKSRIVERNLDTAIFELDKFDPTELQDKLGGTIKIVEIFHDIPHRGSCKPLENDIISFISKKFPELFQNYEGKLPFALSFLSFKNPGEIDTRKLLNFSKKILKSLGINCRFVNKNFSNTKPSTIYKARVIEKGIDLCLIKGIRDLFIGESIAIQDIDSYSLRDYDKPKKDARVGMLPPKLAQVMINLAGQNTKTIYDPFCGTGTVLIESMLMGKQGIGSDLEPRMVEFSEINCAWAKEQFRMESPFKIFQKDAQSLTKKDLPEKIDAVVTEGYLGKPISKIPDAKYQEFAFKELSNLHSNWLRNIHELTPKTCKVVMCVTAYKVGNNLIHLPNFAQLAKQAGYRVTETYTYDRDDQIVARDIKVLEKI
ncbi:MAG: DNA methyltransferase [Candidatus Gracilibacteria bacterium]|nr:DNA methyltransferase [Candidatus Gracilibacteria bacterium]